jgi:hypothetical protein
LITSCLCRVLTVDCVTAVAGVLAADDILMLAGILGDVVPNFAALLAVAFEPAFTDVFAPVGVPEYS